MKVHTNIHDLPVFRNAVITIGTFDGVHSGHRQIISQLQAEAAAIGGETVLITFHPHPKMVVPVSGHEIRILNTPEEKRALLDQLGIDHLVVVPFTTAFAAQEAREYISNFLVASFHPHTIIIGYDHRFGKDRTGDYHFLEEEAATNHYTVKEIPEHVLKNVTISSTKIREALLQADIATANEFLGYDYFFSGKVIEGNKLGRTIGYPTANLQINDAHKLVPGNGVYAVAVELKDGASNRMLRGMMNIGLRPTLGGSARMIEVNLFDFDEMIYGETIKVTVKKHLRQEIKFDGLGALKAQLALDQQDALTALGS